MANLEEIVEISTHRINNPSNRWSDYNYDYIAWRNLTEIAKDPNSFIKQDEVPPKPDIRDYTIL